MNRLQRITSTMAALGAAIVACLPIQKAWAQWSFTVDPTFQTQIVQQNVNDILLNEDGDGSFTGDDDCGIRRHAAALDIVNLTDRVL